MAVQGIVASLAYAVLVVGPDGELVNEPECFGPMLASLDDGGIGQNDSKSQSVARGDQRCMSDSRLGIWLIQGTSWFTRISGTVLGGGRFGILMFCMCRTWGFVCGRCA